MKTYTVAKPRSVRTIGRDVCTGHNSLYAALSAYLGEYDERPLANNTTVRRDIDYDPWAQSGPTIRVRLHRTDILVCEANGLVTFNNGGYQTVTTKQRMNQLIAPFGYGIYQNRFEWFISAWKDTPDLYKGERYEYENGDAYLIANVELSATDERKANV